MVASFFLWLVWCRSQKTSRGSSPWKEEQTEIDWRREGPDIALNGKEVGNALLFPGRGIVRIQVVQEIVGISCSCFASFGGRFLDLTDVFDGLPWRIFFQGFGEKKVPCKWTSSVHVVSDKVGCCVSTKEGLRCLEKASKHPSLGRDIEDIYGQSFPKFPH